MSNKRSEHAFVHETRVFGRMLLSAETTVHRHDHDTWLRHMSSGIFLCGHKDRGQVNNGQTGLQCVDTAVLAKEAIMIHTASVGGFLECYAQDGVIEKGLVSGPTANV